MPKFRGPAAAFAGYPSEEVPKFAPAENWNTLYPTKKITLDKKSPVNRIARSRGVPSSGFLFVPSQSYPRRRAQDLAPPGYATYKNTYPGLFGSPPPAAAPAPAPAATPAPEPAAAAE